MSVASKYTDPAFSHKEVLRVSPFEEKSKTPEQQKHNGAIFVFSKNWFSNGANGSSVMRAFSSWKIGLDFLRKELQTIKK